MQFAIRAAGCLLITAAGAFLASCAAEKPAPDSSASAEVIRLHGVCIQVGMQTEYDMYEPADFWRIDITRDGAVGHIYVGWSPDLWGDNKELLRRQEESPDLPKIIPLGGGQAGQYFGIPKGEEDAYFHLWFDKPDAPANKEILSMVGFC